jgi:hypothetical protein
MIEIDLSKLLQTSGLVRKKVLVRRKGSSPFWSTRWVQEGADIKEVMTSLGFEVVEEDKPELSDAEKRLLGAIDDATKGIEELEGKLKTMIHDGEISRMDQLKIDDMREQIKSTTNIRDTLQRKYDSGKISKPEPEVEVKSTKRVPVDVVNLQGVGNVPSIPASEVRVGDDRMFNQGGTEKIIAIDQKSPKTLLFTYENIDSTTGKNYTQSVRASTKIAIKELYDDEVAAQREARKKRQAAEPTPEPEIVIPEPVVDLKPEVPIDKPESKPKTSESVGKIIGRIEKDFVEPATVELENRISMFRNLKAGINFQGLKKVHVESIADGLEKSIGKYNLKVSYVGWHLGKGTKNIPAMHTRYPRIEGYETISFQKTATKDVVKINERTKDRFAFAKATNIAGYSADLENAHFPSNIATYKRQLAKAQNCTRYGVFTDCDDPLAAMAAHEGYHCVYSRLDVGKKWVENLESIPDYKGTDDPRCCSVSEYGVSSVDELFAETGAAIAYGIDIDPAIKQAFEKTMEGL